MTSDILVTGGTGTLGRPVVRRLHEAGREVRVLSRRSREAKEGIEYVTGDLATGDGIEAAVDGAEIIVHCAGSSKGDEDKARTLVRAAARAGTRHLVNISVVGADRVPVVSGADRAMFGYFASKLAAERVVADSGLPWTTLRATQFHDLILLVAQQMVKLPVIPVPAGFRFQPVERRRGRQPARGAGPRGPGRAGARHGGPARVYGARPAPPIPAGPRQAPPDGAGPDPGEGCPRGPDWRESGSRTGSRPPDLGRLPGRTGPQPGLSGGVFAGDGAEPWPQPVPGERMRL